MASLVLLGCLMCNVLLAWAPLQQPYLSKTLSSPPPKNPNRWTHSVIFEPQPQIQLTCLLYKVTSFLNFQPYFKVFKMLNAIWTGCGQIYGICFTMNIWFHPLFNIYP